MCFECTEENGDKECHEQYMGRCSWCLNQMCPQHFEKHKKFCHPNNDEEDEYEKMQEFEFTSGDESDGPPRLASDSSDGDLGQPKEQKKMMEKVMNHQDQLDAEEEARALELAEKALVSETILKNQRAAKRGMHQAVNTPIPDTSEEDKEEEDDGYSGDSDDSETEEIEEKKWHHEWLKKMMTGSKKIPVLTKEEVARLRQQQKDEKTKEQNVKSEKKEKG